NVTPALHTPLMSLTNAISSIILVGAMLAAGPAELDWGGWLGVLAVALVSINTFGGFLVTQRMLQMFKKKEPKPGGKDKEERYRHAMSANQLALWYLVAAVSFNLALKGLSSPKSARRGNLYGMIGMAIAVLVTLALIYTHSKNVLPILGGMVVGGVIGAFVARRGASAQ